MTRILVLAYLFLSLSMPAQARVLKFSWLPNKEHVSGYRIYGATQSGGPYDLLADVGLPAIKNGRIHWRIDCLDKYHFFVATAYLYNEESPYSNEVALKKLPFPVNDFRCECN